MVPTRPTTRILIVDHSPAAREKLRLVLDSRPDMDVVGEAGTANKALRLLEELEPTTVLMDCDMPDPGSFDLVGEMMAMHRVPIVMLTKQGRKVPPALEARALGAGAVALVALTLEGMSGDTAAQDALARTLRTMSEVKVVRRRGGRPIIPAPANAVDRPARTVASSPAELELQEPPVLVELVAIGASTGGPQAIETILRGLCKRLTVPVLIVQHLSQGFQNNLVQWLSDSTGVQIRIGQHGTPLCAGVAYLAPDRKHMQVNRAGRLVLTDDPPENGSQPSVSVLFRSVAEHYGPKAIGILLTGMGRDGAKELKMMRDRGAITIAQDEATSAVHGMPGEAIKLKGARYVLPPDRIVKVVEHHLPAADSAARREAAACV